MGLKLFVFCRGSDGSDAHEQRVVDPRPIADCTRHARTVADGRRDVLAEQRVPSQTLNQLQLHSIGVIQGTTCLLIVARVDVFSLIRGHRPRPNKRDKSC